MSLANIQETLYNPDGIPIKRNGLVWTVETFDATVGGRETARYDFRPFSEIVTWRGLDLFRLVAVHRRAQVLMLLYYGLSHLNDYLADSDEDYAHWTETHWGAFARWMEERLSLKSRYGYLMGIKIALELSAIEGAGDIDFRDVESLANVLRRYFRDGNLLSTQRAARRAWTSQERERLIVILKEEWWAWRRWFRDSHRSPLSPPAGDLLAVAAAYLCCEETVRPEEINALNVEDVDFENHRLHLHAPNKEAQYIEPSPPAMTLLKAVIAWGALAREELGTTRLFVEPYPRPRSIGSRHLNKRVRKLLRKYRDTYPIARRMVVLADGRKTLGSILASGTQDRTLVQMTMRHRSSHTTHVYYIRQGKKALSNNVARALGYHANRLAIAWNEPVISDPVNESPVDVGDTLQRNPHHSTPYGACSRDVEREGDCNLAIHCGNCPKLIPMASKIDNFVNERDLFVSLAKKAQETGQIRMYENHMHRAGMLDAHIQNIHRRLAQEVNN